MKKKNRFIKTRKFYIVLTTSLLAITALALAIGGLFVKEKSSNFMAYTDFYQSEQYPIGSVSAASSQDVISMTDAEAAGSVSSGYTVTISSAQELYLFSTTLNSNSSFRAYNYKLTGNIDYSNVDAFQPIEGFSGTFDGMGYEISNLNITKASTSGYISMFANNTGTISNFGLINPDVRTPQGSTDLYIAPICGLNQGEISYVFVRDLRNPQTEIDAGMLTNGYHLVAGLVYENRNSLHDSYTAYEIIVNREAVDSINQFSEVLAVNSGTINNLVFYHGSIESYEEVNGKFEIKYDSGTINKEYSLNEHFGIYSSSIEELNTHVTSNDSQDKWHVAGDYGTFATYLAGIITPISRGMSIDPNDSNTFIVSNEADYSYMYELMNMNPFFASSAITYKITSNINLGLIPSINYQYNRVIDCTITGQEGAYNYTTLEGYGYSSYPTITNASISKISTEGIDCYGVFSYVSGEISNLNIVNPTFTYASSTNIQAIGIAVGYLDGGDISNVNIYGSVTFPSNIGKFYVGHVVGLSAGNSVIEEVTAAGTINNTSAASAGNDVNDYMNGSAIGGILGYSTSTFTSLDTCTSNVNITSSTYSDNKKDIVIGGILGAGYTNISKKLENRGTITVTGNSLNIYVAGIIGRHLGMKEQSSYFNNAGDITVTLSGQTTSMIAGVVNADIQTRATSDLAASSLKENGRYQYQAAAFTNGANIVLTNSSANDLEYTNVLNINSLNGFESKISAIYNLQYRTLESKDNLGSQVINMNLFNEFAPVVNVNSSNTVTASQKVDASTIYNLRSLNYTQTAAISAATTFTYTGCMLGEYINYTNVRNEGDMTFTLSQGISAASTLNVSGVFDILTNGYTATSIYNGGNITVTENASANINLDIYAAGICQTNASIITDDSHNPLSVDFDNTTVGTLNNAINNGIISITSSKLNTATSVNNTQTCYLQGNMYVGGITITNNGIISNAFNLGDIFVSLYLSSAKGIYVGGVTYQTDGVNAQIRDSANNGTIKAINLCSSVSSYVYAGGITCLNTRTSTNISELIAFSINYGEIYTFNSKTNSTTATAATYTKSGGILAAGICNIVNTVNYGNVFSTESAGGMIGTINLTSFNTSNEVIIANTLNYGNVKAINNYVTVLGAPSYATYADIKDITSNSQYIAYGFTAEPYYQSVGALIGVVDYNNADIINIRYLINFFENVSIICHELNVPASVTTDVTLLVNVSPNNKFLGQNVTYAPLSTISDEYGNIGVFSEEFMFRLAMEGQNLDENEVTDSYIGDFFQFVAFEKVNTVILDKIGWRTIAYLDAAERFARDLESMSTLLGEANITSSNTLVSDAITTEAWLNNCDITMLENLFDSVLSTNELLSSETQELINYLLFESTYSSSITYNVRTQLVESIISYIENNKENLDYYDLLNSLLYDELLAKVVAKDSTEYQAVLTKIRECLSSSENLEDILDTYIEVLNDDSTLLDPLFSVEYSDYYLEAKTTLLNTLLTGLNDVELEKIYNMLTDSEAGNQAKYLMYLQENSNVSREIYTNIIAYNSFSDKTFMDAMNDAFAKCGIYDIIDTEFDDSMLNRFENSLGEHTEASTNNADLTSLNITPSTDYVDLWNMVKDDEELQAYISNLNNGVLSNVVSVDGENGVGLYAKATEYTNTYQSNDAPSTAGSKTGVLRNTKGQYNEEITNRFIYTPDSVVSTGTYYYGPYQDDSYNIWWHNDNPGTYNRGFDMYTTGQGTQTGDSSYRYIPFFMSLNKEFLQNKINGTYNNTVYEFYWNNNPPQNATNYDSIKDSSTDQWVSTHIIDKSSDDGNTYSIKDYRTGDYIVDYYNFDPSINRTSNNEFDTTNYTVPARTQISFTKQDDANTVVNYTTTAAQALTLISNRSYATGNHYYRNYYLVGYASSSLITGIWYQQNIWRSGGVMMGAFLTAKDDEFVDGYEGVHTTQYINYFVEDLVNLDGILTKGFGGNVVSTDEANIINALMTKILSTDSGKQAVLKAIASKSLAGFDSSEADFADILLNSADDTSFAVSSVERLAYLTEEELSAINYNNNLTLKAHLDSLISNVVYDLKEQIIIKSLNNQENFRKVILECYEYSEEAAKYYEYNIPVSGMNNFIYNYVNYLYENHSDITDTEITELLATATDADLTTLTNLYSYSAMLPDGYIYKGYTFNGEWIINDLATPISYDDVSYNRYLNADIESTINFNTGSNNSIVLTYIGTITINGETHTNNTLGTYEWNLSSNTDYTITCDIGTKIYNLGYPVSTYIDETPYLSDDIITNSTIGNSTFAAAFQLTSNQANNLTLSIPEINNDTVESVSIAFSYFRGSNNNRFTYTINGVTSNAIQVSNSNTEYQMPAIELTTFPQNIVFVSTQTNSNRLMYIYKLRLIFEGTLSNGDSYVFTQYFNADGSNTNTIEITNSSGELQYQIGAGSINELTNGTTTINSGITSSVLFYAPSGYSILDTSGITGDYSDSIEDNFNNYYSSLSDVGKYFTSMTLTNNTSFSSVTITEPSYVLVKANNTDISDTDGTVTLNGASKTITDNSAYYCYYIKNNGTYNITSNNVTITEVLIIDADASIVNSTNGLTNIIGYKDDGNTIEVFNADYSTIPNFNINSYIANALEGKTKYESYLSIYPYIRTDGISDSQVLREADLVELVMTLFPTIKQDDSNANYWSVFKDSSFSEQDLIEIIKLISVADYADYDSALGKLAVYLGADYEEILKLIAKVSSELELEALTQIKDIANTKNYSSIISYYIAAYVGADFITNMKSNTLESSILHKILDSYSGGSYQFIDSNTTIDSDIFISLMTHLGFNLSTEGYGIYALSSSKGILNGEFLPDNIVLDNMDVNYEITGNNYFELSSDSSSNWRGGTDSNENDTTNNESVNYAVLVEMKQLKKSIGTTIFELNLVDNNGVTHYSSESAIDLENGIITYYVPTNYFNNVSTTLTIEEDTISVSNLASICMSGSTTDLRKDSVTNTVTLTNLQAEDVIRVYAEDTTVYKDYTIQFVEMDIAFDLVYSSVQNGTMDSTTQATVNYKDGIVVLSLTSDTLPEKLDLTPYIDIYSGTEAVERITSFKLSNEEDDHVINSSHDAIITMEILSSLPYGSYTIVVNIFGVSDSVILIKNPSTECEILEFEYDGIDISESLVTNGEYTNYIDFGRAYDYSELKNYEESGFYLNRFSISENATCEITVTKSEDSEGLLTYQIEYLITAENGNQATYTHYLVEKHPFKNYSDSGALSTAFNYASYYKDGDLVNTLEYEDDTNITVEFDRGSEPQYRVKYTLSNFYILGTNVEFIIDASQALGATYVDSYAGITATVTNDCDAGIYTFVYNYHNIGTWSDGEYERSFTFPEFIIIKNYSKDATLNNITYIDGMSMLSSTSTVISAESVFRPIDDNIENNEIGYYEFSEIPEVDRHIAALGTMINYQNSGSTDYADESFKDYYLIGSLSNAKLAYYAPIFKIEDHAEIYQYTTAYKLANYGEGQQGNITDSQILTTRDTVYIYVPYTTDGETVEIFLVEITEQNQWTNVYTVEDTTTVIATLTENKGSFSYNGNEYEIHSSAGKPTDNTSLYMDYIGTPLQDHFWYVSYVVFSEHALHTDDNTNVKYFHLSLIDLTNNLYFEISVNAPIDFALDSIYVTFAAEGVKDGDNTVTKQLSAYVIKTEDIYTDEEGNEYYIYLLDYDIQILPTGYYYFYFDIPNGYKIEYEITNGKDNNNKSEDYIGAYYPPSSIVTQRIEISFTILEDEEHPATWGVTTGDIYSIKASEIVEE